MGLATLTVGKNGLAKPAFFEIDVDDAFMASTRHFVVRQTMTVYCIGHGGPAAVILWVVDIYHAFYQATSRKT